jgi:hypothetical protein
MVASSGMVARGRRYRLLTSRGLAPAAKKYVDVPAGGTLTLCRLEGVGRIVRLWLTLPLIGQRTALKDAVVRMYWDGEEDPSVEVPLGDFFGAAFGRPVRLISEPLLIVGGGYVSRFEMPFNDGAIIELRNESKKNLCTVFFQVGYYEEPARSEREATFHAQFRRDERTKNGEPFVALRASGEGRLAGLRVDLQARDWWLKPPFSEIPLPRGFGLGILEGWEEIIVDGDQAGTLSGTGAEDYFSGGFYFLGGPFCTPSYGCTRRNFLTGRVSAYRFHLDDPVYFSRSLQITLDHGLSNSMAGDYTSVAYWYQREPHAPLHALPSIAARRPTWPWMNPIQWVFIAAVFSLLLTSAVCLAIR